MRPGFGSDPMKLNGQRPYAEFNCKQSEAPLFEVAWCPLRHLDHLGVAQVSPEPINTTHATWRCQCAHVCRPTNHGGLKCTTASARKTWALPCLQFRSRSLKLLTDLIHQGVRCRLVTGRGKLLPRWKDLEKERKQNNMMFQYVSNISGAFSSSHYRFIIHWAHSSTN